MTALPLAALPAPAFSALVVDADPSVRQSVRLSLEVDGGHVLGVGGIAAARAALATARFDVALVDVTESLARDDGDLAALRADHPELALVAITAAPSLASAVAAMQRGARDYLGKPFSSAQVRGAARRALARREPGARPGHAATPPAATAIALGGSSSLEEITREHIVRVLAQAATVDAAARVLGIDISTLQRKRKRYGLR